MTRLYNMWFSLMSNLKNNKGQGMVEYVLIIAFIAVVLILTLTNLGTAIGNKFTEVINSL